MKARLEELDNKMYNLNRNLSALVHIQKVKSKEEAERFLIRINQEIAKWIKEVRDIHESIGETAQNTEDLQKSEDSSVKSTARSDSQSLTYEQLKNNQEVKDEK